MSTDIFAEVAPTERPGRATKHTNEFGPAVKRLAEEYDKGNTTLTLSYPLSRITDEDTDTTEQVLARARRFLTRAIEEAGLKERFSSEMRQKDGESGTVVFWLTAPRIYKPRAEKLTGETAPAPAKK